ncbi:MAG: hypothetical protein Q4G42_07215 [Neisseria sp.]|nr:hypothetical protein [Neisseria sp.]
MLQEIHEQTGILSPELENLPTIPLPFAHVWAWFHDLSRTRQSGMGITAISYAEMLAYFQLSCIRVQRWEIELLMMFDVVFIDVMSSEPTETLNRL